MKKIEIEIPEGKKAEWVDGVLTLVDEKPKDITERIKTFDDAVKALGDACNVLGDDHPLVLQYYRAVAAFKYEPMTEDLLAYLKLRVICAALNEGWKPTFNDGEYRYHPWLYVYTKEEYDKFDDEEKTYCVPLRSNNVVDAYGGLVYAHAFPAGSNSYSKFGVRLTLKTRELAEYCGKQFMDIWADFLFG